MEGLGTQFVLIAILILLNAAFAGSEIALVSLREGQIQRLEAAGGSGAVLAKLARDPNRFLATIQIVITLAGFFASASAALTLSGPLSQYLTWFGDASEGVAFVLVTLMISYLTLVLGELAPKRLAMQRAERWSLLMAQPLSIIARLAKPAVWLLSRSSDVVVRMFGGDPSRHGEEVTEEEIKEIIGSQASFTPEQRAIIGGALEISDRSLREILIPRREVVVLGDETPTEQGVETLLESGFSRAPVAPNGELDEVVGTVHLRDLVGKTGVVGDLASPPAMFPETVGALVALREMQQSRQHLAIVISEHGSVEGIVTIEDLIEEVVGEIYDESDADIVGVERMPDNSIVLPGRFPVHDLTDIGIEMPEGPYTTVAGLALDAIGRLPEPGEKTLIDSWELTVLAVEDRAITKVSLRSVDPPEPGDR